MIEQKVPMKLLCCEQKCAHQKNRLCISVAVSGRQFQRDLQFSSRSTAQYKIFCYFRSEEVEYKFNGKSGLR